MNHAKISSVEQYIKRISEILNRNEDQDKIIVFRGEPKDYGATTCVPGIFRSGILHENKRFEKNLFDEMRANGLSNGENYLENAISAQHDGFPSRLLDVSYNCLVALYFACTPYYRRAETEHDGEDGRVFAFSIEKMFCPTADNIVKSYKEIISPCEQSFIGQQIFAKNHKIIDHIRTNNRIIAQQGAFILFQGSDYEPLPRRICETVIIDGNHKADLRRDLKNLFGIDTGSIYPQVDNLIENMIKKSQYVDNSTFDFDSEAKMVLYNLGQDIDYYVNRIVTKPDSAYPLLRELEDILKGYRIGIENIRRAMPERAEGFIQAYNDAIRDEMRYLSRILTQTQLSISAEDFTV